MDTNPLQPEPTPVSQPVEPQPEPTPVSQPEPTLPPPVPTETAPDATIPSVQPAPGTPNLVLVQLPIWQNPRMYIAAAAAIIIIVAGIFLSKGSGLKGSFDNFDPTQDFKIQAFTISQPADGSFEIGYKIDKKASNLFMAITKPTEDDLPENDEMIKLIALADADLSAGEHKIQLTTDDLKAAFTAPTGTYRFQIIAYNNSDEITDFKAEKRTVTVDAKGVKLVAPAK